mgnify:CR=1 FL=1
MKVFGEEPAAVCVRERVHAVQLGDSGVSATGGPSTSGILCDTVSKPTGFNSAVEGIHFGNRTSLLTAGENRGLLCVKELLVFCCCSHGWTCISK